MEGAGRAGEHGVIQWGPEGPLTIKSFRTAAKRGDLAWVKVAGKIFTSPDSVREMLRPVAKGKEDTVSVPSSPAPNDGGLSAQEAARTTLASLRMRRKPDGKS